MYVCMYMHIRMYVCTYVCTYAYVYMYIEKFVTTFWHTKFFCYVDKVLYVFPIIIITSCSHLNSYHIAQFFQEGNFHEFVKNSPLKSWIRPICEKFPPQIYSAIW